MATKPRRCVTCRTADADTGHGECTPCSDARLDAELAAQGITTRALPDHLIAEADAISAHVATRPGRQVA